MITIISRLNIELNTLEKLRELNCQFDALLIRLKTPQNFERDLFQNFEGFLNSRNRECPISPVGNLSIPLFVNVQLKLRRTRKRCNFVG